jgi:hypothetical protein
MGQGGESDPAQGGVRSPPPRPVARRHSPRRPLLPEAPRRAPPFSTGRFALRASVVRPPADAAVITPLSPVLPAVGRVGSGSAKRSMPARQRWSRSIIAASRSERRAVLTGGSPSSGGGDDGGTGASGGGRSSPSRRRAAPPGRRSGRSVPEVQKARLALEVVAHAVQLAAVEHLRGSRFAASSCRSRVGKIAKRMTERHGDQLGRRVRAQRLEDEPLALFADGSSPSLSLNAKTARLPARGVPAPRATRAAPARRRRLRGLLDGALELVACDVGFQPVPGPDS